jgi:hypothetical protein
MELAIAENGENWGEELKLRPANRVRIILACDQHQPQPLLS